MPLLWGVDIQERKDHIMLNTIEARDLCEGDALASGVVESITTGPTGLLVVEVAAYPGSVITREVTLSPIDVVQVTY